MENLMSVEMIGAAVGAVVVVGLVVKLLGGGPRKVKIDTGADVADDKRTKQGFALKSVPKDIDVIVIGSGVSGLTTAALLAKDQGKTVLVLEQHDQAGGNLHVFEEPCKDGGQYEFDTGLHYVGRTFADKRMPLRKLLDYICDTPVEWAQMDDAYDHAVFKTGDGNVARYPMCSDIKKLRQNLIDSFPEDEKPILKYFELVRSTVRFGMPLVMMFKLMPTWLSGILRPILAKLIPVVGYFDKTSLEVLQSLGFKNEKAISVLTYSWGDYGDQPSRGAFPMTALLADHFKHGGYYPVGGPSAIARQIVRTIERNGGKVLVRAPVDSILMDDAGTKALGVIVKGKQIRAKSVISSVGFPITYTRLIPEKHRHIVQKDIDLIVKDEQVAPAISLMSLFVGISDPNEELKLPRSNFWVFSDWDHDKSCERYKNDKDADFPALFISFSSVKDPSYKERCPKKHVCLVIVPAYYEHFEKFKDKRVKHRGDEYMAIKKEYEERLLKALLDEFPQLKGKIDYVDLGTPVTNDFYLGNYRGACYGLGHTPKRFQLTNLTPNTPFKNLYMTGQDTVANGIAGAAISGVFTNIFLDKSFLIRRGHKFL